MNFGSCQYSLHLPANVHWISFSSNRCQQSCSLTQWQLSLACFRSRGVWLTSFKWTQLYTLAFTDVCWTFTENKKWRPALWGSEWHLSVVVKTMKDKQNFRWQCTAVTPCNKEHFNMLYNTNWWIMSRELAAEWDIGFKVLETMVELGISQCLCQVDFTNAHTETIWS